MYKRQVHECASFRHRIVRDDQQELLVFVTPVIVKASAAKQLATESVASTVFDHALEP